MESDAERVVPVAEHEVPIPNAKKSNKRVFVIAAVSLLVILSLTGLTWWSLQDTDSKKGTPLNTSKKPGLGNVASYESNFTWNPKCHEIFDELLFKRFLALSFYRSSEIRKSLASFNPALHKTFAAIDQSKSVNALELMDLCSSESHKYEVFDLRSEPSKGKSVVRAIKSRPYFHAVPIIFVKDSAREIQSEFSIFRMNYRLIGSCSASSTNCVWLQGDGSWLHIDANGKSLALDSLDLYSGPQLDYHAYELQERKEEKEVSSHLPLARPPEACFANDPTSPPPPPDLLIDLDEKRINQKTLLQRFLFMILKGSSVVLRAFKEHDRALNLGTECEISNCFVCNLREALKEVHSHGLNSIDLNQFFLQKEMIHVPKEEDMESTILSKLPPSQQEPKLIRVKTDRLRAEELDLNGVKYVLTLACNCETKGTLRVSATEFFNDFNFDYNRPAYCLYERV